MIEAASTRFFFEGLTPLNDDALLTRLSDVVTINEVTKSLGLFTDESMDDQVKTYIVFSAMQIQTYLNRAIFRQTVRDYFKEVAPQYKLTATPNGSADLVWTATQHDMTNRSITINGANLEQNTIDSGDAFYFVHRETTGAYSELSRLKLLDWFTNPVHIKYGTQCDLKIMATIKQAIFWYANLCFQSRGEVIDGINDRHIKNLLQPFKSPIVVPRVTRYRREYVSGNYYASD